MGITVCPINSDAVFDITVLYAMYHQDGEACEENHMKKSSHSTLVS